MRIDELGLTENDYIHIDVNSERFMLLDDLPNEVWRDVVGFENYYQVSNYGRVKSLTRKVKASIKYNNRITRKSCILKQYKKHDKYWGVALCKDGKHYNKQVHILVGKVFLQNDDCKKCIDHIKPVSTKYCNNYLYNLRYATHKENSKFANDKGRLKQPLEHYRKCVIKLYDNNIVKTYKSIRECSRLEHISRRTLYKILDTDICYNNYTYKLLNNDYK